MKINVFADTICGWCFIGHINLNNTLKKFPKIKFDIHHIPFQLNPNMPAEGISRAKYLERKFRGKNYATPMHEKMKVKASNVIAIDSAGILSYLAPRMLNLQLTIERHPNLTFNATREH